MCMYLLGSYFSGDDEEGLEITEECKKQRGGNVEVGPYRAMEVDKQA